MQRSIAAAICGVAGLWLAGQAHAASDSPVVFCHDPERNLVTTTMIGDCKGEIVSAEEAAEIKENRRLRIMQAMAPERPPVPTGRKLKSIGTGFFVSEDGTLMTNEHVVHGCNDLTVELTTGTKVPGKVKDVDERYDLALVTSEAAPPATVVFRSRPTLAQGARADLVGYPTQGIAPIKPFFTDAVIMEGEGDVSVPPSHFLINGDVRHGNSGGPVLDDAGMVVGVIFAKADTPKIYEKTGQLVRNVGIAVRNDIVFDFLARNGVAVAKSDAGNAIPRENVFDAARPFIARIGCWK